MNSNRYHAKSTKLQTRIGNMKVFLDDERKPPDDSWTLLRWPNEVIDSLLTNEVTHLSLDHDLGNDEFGTGNDVIIWLEEAVYFGKVKAPIITIHSANASARKKMLMGVEKIKQYEQP